MNFWNDLIILTNLSTKALYTLVTLSMILLLMAGTIFNLNDFVRHLSASDEQIVVLDTMPTDDIDSNIVACGHWKCFSRSKSNSILGYQMIRNGDIEPERSENDLILRGKEAGFSAHLYQIAQCITKQYGIPHVVGYPHYANLTQDFINQMVRPADKPDRVVKKLFEPGEIVVLPVKYNEKSVFFAIPGRTDDLKDHIRHYIPENPEFYDNFKEAMQKVYDTVSDYVGCLVVDFQGLVDENGIFYLFDIDSCRWTPDCSLQDPSEWTSAFNPVLRNEQILPFQRALSGLMEYARDIRDEHYAITYNPLLII